jgi:abortive infection bacteriophage resistance protein
MEYKKPYKTYAEQVAIWSKRGLIINNPAEAEKLFSRLNYYRLSAYALPFQKEKDIFNKATSWEDIVDLYEFDRELRIKILDCLEIIEVAFRTSICHKLAYIYGPFGYADAKNFHPKFDHNSWISVLTDEVNRSKETFVTHFQDKYKNTLHFPIWMTAEVMSFGTVSKLYKGLNFSDKKNIAKEYDIPAPVYESWLHFFTYIRNLCAHHARVWNRELAIRPKYPSDKIEFQRIRNERIVCFFVVTDYIFRVLKVERNIYKEFEIILKGHNNINLKSMGFENKEKQLD